mmetsp:Transcript_18335/g.62323  ORF Transcript_18335/g.62323 Transcript_18335/m.62323 type:complete len:304 (+) Transcript_18335:1484-2395(+)
MSAYERARFAFTPLGGSFVSLMPFCSTGTGKILVGIDVSHSRNSSCTSDARSPCIASTMRSSSSIQLEARWQFCRQTQSPLCCADLMMRSAMGPWPWPSEMMCSLSPGTRSMPSANRCSIPVGSAPVDRMNITGVDLVVSAYTCVRLKGGASVKRGPRWSPTYALKALTSFSSRRTRTSRSFCSADSFSSHSPGSAALCGSSLSAHIVHSGSVFATVPLRPSHAEPTSERHTSCSHCGPVSASGSGFFGIVAGGMPPLSRKFQSGVAMSPAARWMAVQMRKLNMPLCASNRPRHTVWYMKSVV